MRGKPCSLRCRGLGTIALLRDSQEGPTEFSLGQSQPSGQVVTLSLPGTETRASLPFHPQKTSGNNGNDIEGLLQGCDGALMCVSRCHSWQVVGVSHWQPPPWASPPHPDYTTIQYWQHQLPQTQGGEQPALQCPSPSHRTQRASCRVPCRYGSSSWRGTQLALGRGRTLGGMKEATAGGQWASRSVETGASCCCVVAGMQRLRGKRGLRMLGWRQARTPEEHDSKWTHLRLPVALAIEAEADGVELGFALYTLL